MSIQILIANILTFGAFVIHAFIGDRELKIIEPHDEVEEKCLRREKWTMARSSWHWISLDLLFASIGLALINFTDVILNEEQVLQVFSIYFLGYGIAWIIGIAISKKFPKNYLRLGQWILLWLISALIYWEAY